MNPIRLRQILRQHFGLKESDLTQLAREEINTNTPLEEIVVKKGIATREKLYEAYAAELNIPYIDLNHYTVDQATLEIIPAPLARKLRVIPIFHINNTLTIATANPEDIAVIDELNRELHLDINCAIALPESIENALNQYYPLRNNPVIENTLLDLNAEELLPALCPVEEEARSLEELASQAPVVRFVDTIIEQALNDKASDIHIEPEENNLTIRVRIDGLLQERGRFPTNLHPLVTSRIKLLAGMDISEKRKPQDGQFEFKSANRRVDIRVSSFPTIYGENVVLRLLDKALGPMTVEMLGLDEKLTPVFRNLIHQPHGIILITGPTGSGKSTTLYAILNELNTPEKNIITLEDPVEYHLPGIRQCQVNPRAGLTFATGLRAILRQDPDIIMVGEIRDQETAEIAFQAALTGHLVLATLHTNDAPSALTRMIDMKVEPFLIASSVIAILAQRLVRRVCEHCGESYTPPLEILERLQIEPGPAFRRGRGCPACGNRGLRGRMGIFELLVVTPEIRRLVMQNSSSEEIRDHALNNGMRTLRQDGIEKALAGLTTPEEVLRATADA